MAGYTVGINSETKAFKQGIESGVIEPLEDAQKELDELGRNRGPEQLERSLKDAQDATEKLADETADAARDIEREFRDTYRKMKSESDDAFKGASKGAEEFKDEAKQSVKETAASFSDVTDGLDLVQEVAANAFAGFGPAGVAAGAAAAIGIGAAVSGFEAVSEAEEESRERAAEWAQAFVEAGGKVLTAATTAAIALDIATDAEKFKTAQENAKNWGVDVSVAIAAMSGEAWALKAANDTLAESEAKIGEEWDKAEGQYAGFGDALSSQNVQAEKGRDSLNRLTAEMELGGKQADAYSQYLIQVAEHTEGAIRTTDEFGDTIVTLPDGKTVYIDAETGQATMDVDAIDKKIYGIRDGHADVTVGTTDAQRTVDRFVSLNSGREIRIGTKIVSGGLIP